jgi:hypothetical protein
VGTPATQSISEDYDHDYIEPVDQLDAELDQELVLGDQIEQDIDQLLNSAIAIESFGMNKTTYVLLQKFGLLAGTSLDALGVESFGRTNGDDPESQMAVESLLDTMKEKAGAWSNRVIGLAKTVSDKVVALIDSMWAGISTNVKALGSKTWDATKTAGRTMKAHPYKTVAGAAVAAVAAVGIIALVMNGMSGACANESALKTFLNRISGMVKDIKWPFGKIASEVVEHKSATSVSYKLTTTVVKSAQTIAEEGAVAELGWTQSAVKAIGGSMSKLTNTVSTVGRTVGTKVVDTAKLINSKTGNEMGDFIGGKVGEVSKSKLSGWAVGEVVKKLYNTALWSIVGLVVFLFKEVVLKTYRYVKEALTSVKANVQTA